MGFSIVIVMGGGRELWLAGEKDRLVCFFVNLPSLAVESAIVVDKEVAVLENPVFKVVKIKFSLGFIDGVIFENFSSKFFSKMLNTACFNLYLILAHP